MQKSAERGTTGVVADGACDALRSLRGARGDQRGRVRGASMRCILIWIAERVVGLSELCVPCTRNHVNVVSTLTHACAQGGASVIR